MNMVTVTHISMLSPLTRHSRMRKKKKTCLFVFVFFRFPSLAMCYKRVKWTRSACNPRPYTVHDINERSTMSLYSSRENKKRTRRAQHHVVRDHNVRFWPIRSFLFIILSKVFRNCPQAADGVFLQQLYGSGELEYCALSLLFSCSIVALLCL